MTGAPDDKPAEREENALLTFLLATEIVARQVSAGSAAVTALESWCEQTPPPPWNILIVATFPAIDAALTMFMEGLPPFIDRRSSETGIDMSMQIERSTISTGSAKFTARQHAIGTRATLTIEARTIRHTESLLHVTFTPHTSIGKQYASTMMGAFLTWFMRDQATWAELGRKGTDQTADIELLRDLRALLQELSVAQPTWQKPPSPPLTRSSRRSIAKRGKIERLHSSKCARKWGPIMGTSESGK